MQTGKGLRLANVTFDSNTDEHYKRLGCYPFSQNRRRPDNSPSKHVSPSKDKECQDEARLSNESEDETDCHRKKISKQKPSRKRKLKTEEEKQEEKIKPSETTESGK